MSVFDYINIIYNSIYVPADKKMIQGDDKEINMKCNI